MKDFDNIDFDELFNDAELPIDTDEVWDAVEPRLEKKRKRRFFFLFFWGIGAAFLIGLGLLVGYNSFDDEGGLVDNDSQIIENSSSNYSSEIPSDDKPDDYDSLEESALAENELDVKNNGRKSSNSSRNKASFTNDNTTRRQGNKSNPSNSFDTSISDTRNEGSQGFSNQEDVNLNNGGNDKLGDNAEKDILTSDGYSDKKEEKSTKESSDKSKDKNIKDKTLKEKEEKNKDKKPKKKPKKKKSSKKKPKKKRKSKWTIFVDIYGGGSYPFRQLSDNPDVLGLSSSLIDIRNQHEKMLFSFQGGMDIKCVHKIGLLLGIGLQYERITERFKYQNQTTEVETEQTVISQVVDGGNNLVSQQMGLVEVTTITTRNISIYNQHDFYNIPISIGYRYKYNKKLHLEYTGGLDLNIMFNAKGYHFTSELSTRKVKSNLKKGAVSPSLWGAFGVDYKWNKKTSIIGGIYLKQQLGSISQSDYDLRQKYFIPGIRLGARFEL